MKNLLERNLLWTGDKKVKGIIHDKIHSSERIKKEFKLLWDENEIINFMKLC